MWGRIGEREFAGRWKKEFLKSYGVCKRLHSRFLYSKRKHTKIISVCLRPKIVPSHNQDD